MTASIHTAERYGLKVWLLENETWQVTLLPAPGGKLVSLYDKRNRVEWLAPPALPPRSTLAYGASWDGPGSYGWDEMMPTIAACPYPGPGELVGVALPDHGELWTQPWQAQVAGDAVSMEVAGQVLPYTFARSVHLVEPDLVVLEYSVRNEGQAPLVYLWAAHPLFWCEAGAEIVLPAEVEEVVNVLPREWGTQWGAQGAHNPWPCKVGEHGTLHLDRVGSITQRAGRKFYMLPAQRVHWAGLWRPAVQAGLQVAWSGEQIGYLGIWVDEGALYPRSAVVAIEPTSGYYDNLAAAAAAARAPLLAPGAVHEWQVSVRTGSHRPPFG